MLLLFCRRRCFWFGTQTTHLTYCKSRDGSKTFNEIEKFAVFFPFRSELNETKQNSNNLLFIGSGQIVFFLVVRVGRLISRADFDSLSVTIEVFCFVAATRRQNGV